MIEMAIVGLGSWGLCVLERTVSRARQAGTPARVHVVEPARLGGGAYAAEQPDFLVLNNACGQLSLYAAPDGDALPPYAVGLYQWAVACGYRWVGHECRIGAGGDPILPTDYLPRRLMGEYLGWFYNTLLDYAPPNLEIVRHHAPARCRLPPCNAGRSPGSAGRSRPGCRRTRPGTRPSIAGAGSRWAGWVDRPRRCGSRNRPSDSR